MTATITATTTRATTCACRDFGWPACPLHGDGHGVRSLFPARGPVDEPVDWCARCSSTDVRKLRDCGRELSIACRSCGHVMSLVAYRALADRMATEEAEAIAAELHQLAGIPVRIFRLRGVL